MFRSRYVPVSAVLVVFVVLSSFACVVRADEMESEIRGPRTTGIEESREADEADEVSGISAEKERESLFSRFKRFVRKLFGRDERDQKREKPPEKDTRDERETVDTGTTEEYVRSLYRDILRREPDPGGFNHWVSYIDNGKVSRRQARELFYQSDEYRSRFGHTSDRDDNDNDSDNKDTNEDVEGLPFRWSEVEWVSGNEPVGDWPQTINMTSASIGHTINWSYDKPFPNWPATRAIHNHPNACLGFVTKVDGKWCAGIGEWLLPGQTVQARKALNSKRGDKTFFSGPMKDFKPESGQEFYLFVCGLNWVGQGNVKERSNLVKVTYP